MRRRSPLPSRPSLSTAVLALVLGLTLVGCGTATSPAANASREPSASPASPTGGSADTSSAPSASPSGPAASGSPSAGTSAPAGGSLAAGDPAHVRVDLDTVAKGLEAPLGIAATSDGSGRVFVIEQAGRIRIVQDGRLVDRPFLDIADRISSGGERGLLGLAFEPDYGAGSANRFYVNYTDTNGNTVIAEYRASTDNPDVADAASERALLRVAQPFANHNGGSLAFGPDRMLYAGLGDGGSGGDPMGNGQRLDTLLGKLLRLDPLGVAGSKLAPADNPFASRPGAKPEIWSYGLRNPWRFTFDRATGDLWIGDVGQGAWEEIDLSRRADGGGREIDYGWNVMEGAHCYPDGDACDRNGLTLPVAEYGHDQGCAVVGGYVDRAADAGPLAGVYLFSDNCSGRIWGLSSAANGAQKPVVLNDGGRSISSFGEDADGHVLATDLSGGELLRVVGAPR